MFIPSFHLIKYLNAKKIPSSFHFIFLYSSLHYFQNKFFTFFSRTTIKLLVHLRTLECEACLLCVVCKKMNIKGK
jgi:hypothetical protein